MPRRSSLTIALLFASFSLTSIMNASTLGTAASFAVLGGSTVTNTGASVLIGNLGLYPGTSITGFPPGTVIGTTYINNGVAQQAQADALIGYNALAALPFTSNLTGVNLGGLTLTPGVYFFSSSAQLTGPLTLNFQGLSNVNVVFQIGSTLTTASASMVTVTNPGTNNHIYWQVGSSATLGTTTTFLGSILANQSITLTTGATIQCGNAIALNGAVTLDTNLVDVGSCTSGASPIPEASSLTLLATGAVATGATLNVSGFSFLGVCGGIAAFRRKWLSQA